MRRRAAEAAGVLAILIIAWIARVEPQHDVEAATAIAPQTLSTAALPAPLAQLEPVARPASPTEAKYVGNTNTHKFHLLSCRHARCPNCVAKFTTRQEAIDGGFRPCGVCDP